MEGLYPAIGPHDRGMLDVGGGHRIHWEVSGDPEGRPAVVVHGGPGGASDPLTRRHFDPSAYRIVQFDQRGCGRSTPHVADSVTDPDADPDAGLAGNTTWDLVADLERLRAHLGIERWLLLGGSWGATLALAYAETHPDRVSGLVLRGVFTARRCELDWLYAGGAAWLFPEDWERFLAPVPDERRHDPLAAYAALLSDPDPAVRQRAAVAWSEWEGALVSITPRPAHRARYADPAFAVPFARLAVHYFTHDAWLDDGALLRDADRLAGIPGAIVQGRYDAVCPPATAHALHRAWPDSTLTVLDTAGHAVTDPGILPALRSATDRFAAGGRA